MTIEYVLSLALRLIGLVQWADGLLQKHEAKVKAQQVADAPTTDKEWTDAAEKGDL